MRHDSRGKSRRWDYDLSSKFCYNLASSSTFLVLLLRIRGLFFQHIFEAQRTGRFIESAMRHTIFLDLPFRPGLLNDE